MRFLAATVLLLASCEGEQPAPEDTCDAGSFQQLIGQDAHAGKDLPDPKRMYRLGDAVTMDFNPARLNIKLDAAGKIAVIDCG